jgi:hypothetical protein
MVPSGADTSGMARLLMFACASAVPFAASLAAMRRSPWPRCGVPGRQPTKHHRNLKHPSAGDIRPLYFVVVAMLCPFGLWVSSMVYVLLILPPGLCRTLRQRQRHVCLDAVGARLPVQGCLSD